MNKEQEKLVEMFSDGLRMIMIVQRNKEGGKSNEPQRYAKKKITRNKEEFYQVLEEFKEIKEESEEPLRIYSCLNRRDINKAIREFKKRQLDNDYSDQTSREAFYHDIKNRWISCFMKPSSREETLFLIDIDEPEKNSLEMTKKHLEEIGVEIITDYETKNGYHLITSPFNQSLFDGKFGELKKDALLLLDY